MSTTTSWPFAQVFNRSPYFATNRHLIQELNCPYVDADTFQSTFNLPSHWCINYLLDRCYSTVNRTHRVAYCSSGFHPTPEAMELELQVYSIFETESANSEACPICLEPIEDQFTVPINCRHVFCKSCITGWMNINSYVSQSAPVSCPVCRQVSPYVNVFPAVYPELFQSKQLKLVARRIMYQEKAALTLFTAPRRRTSGRQRRQANRYTPY